MILIVIVMSTLNKLIIIIIIIINRSPYKVLKDEIFAENIYAEVAKVDFDSNFI